MTYTVSIIGLIIGTLFNMILGALWYSVLFGKPWMKEANISADDVASTDGMGQVYGLTALTALITSYVLGWLVVNLSINNLFEGILLAIILWLGTQLPSIIKNWGFEKRTIKLGLINHGYDFTVYIFVITMYVFIGKL